MSADRDPTENESMKNQYQDPPKKHSRKSRTRKPKGLPRAAEQQVSAGVLFRKVAREQVRVEVDGAAKIKMTYWDAYVRQIYAMALNKNTSAARLLEHLRRQFPGDALPGDPIVLPSTKRTQNFRLWNARSGTVGQRGSAVEQRKRRCPVSVQERPQNRFALMPANDPIAD